MFATVFAVPGSSRCKREAGVKMAVQAVFWEGGAGSEAAERISVHGACAETPFKSSWGSARGVGAPITARRRHLGGARKLRFIGRSCYQAMTGGAKWTFAAGQTKSPLKIGN